MTEDAMYCFKCGFGVPASVVFCPKCGQDLRGVADAIARDKGLGADAVQQSSSSAAPPRYETAETNAYVVEVHTPLFGRNYVVHEFVAHAIGPTGRYVVLKSAKFECWTFQGVGTVGRVSESLYPQRDEEERMRKVFDEFLGKLTADGWDYIGKHSDGRYFELRLRRLAQ